MRRMPFSQPAVAADGLTATPSRTRRSNGPQAISACWYTRRPSAGAPALAAHHQQVVGRATPRSRTGPHPRRPSPPSATAAAPSVRYTSTGARDSALPGGAPGVELGEEAFDVVAEHEPESRRAAAAVVRSGPWWDHRRMTRILVQATASPGFPALDALALDLMMVTQDGNIAKELGRFPVTGGAAEVPGRAAGRPGAALGDPDRRHGPRRARLPLRAAGVPARRPPRSRIFGDRIRIHRGGGNLGLDAPDGAPQVLIDFVRDNLPHGFQLQGIDVAADPQGRYQSSRSRGRYRPLPVASVDLEYRRGFAIAPGLDPGRPRRVAVAWPQGHPARRRPAGRCSPPLRRARRRPGRAASRRRCRRWHSTSAS